MRACHQLSVSAFVAPSRTHLTAVDVFMLAFVDVRILPSCRSIGANPAAPDGGLDGRRQMNLCVIPCRTQEGQYYTDTTGNRSYMAPEVVLRRYNKESDIW